MSSISIIGGINVENARFLLINDENAPTGSGGALFDA